MEVKVKGDPPPILFWFHNGKAVMADYSIKIDEQGNLFFPSIEPKHTGVYKLIATNMCGKVEKEVKVSVMIEEYGCVVGGGEINRPVPVPEFGVFVSKQCAHGNKKFSESYKVKFLYDMVPELLLYTPPQMQRLPSKEAGHNVTLSVTAENKTKNRFINIKVCECTLKIGCIVKYIIHSPR